MANIIRNSLKVFFFKAFRRFALERRQPFIGLSHQKSNEKSSLSGQRIFSIADFWQDEAQNAVNPFGFTSILTKYWRKSAFKKLFRIILANLSI